MFTQDLALSPAHWQRSLFSLILRASLILGSVVYVPSMIVAVRRDLYGIVVVDTLALLSIAVLLRWPNVPYRWRAGSYCFILYMLAVGLLLWVGPISQIYLFGFSVLTALFLGLRAGLGAAFLSSVTLFTIGSLGLAAPGMLVQTYKDDLVIWVVITLNFTLVNTLLTLAIGVVLTAFNRVLDGEVAARQSLERERKLLRILLDSLPDLVFTKDREGRYVNANAASLAYVGLDREDQLAGKTNTDFYPPARAEKYHAEDLAVLAGQTVRNREERSIGPAGTPVWYLTMKVPLYDTDGTITGLLGISRDVTDRKEAEANRLRLLAQLQLQVERMPLAYLLADGEMRYTRWNPTAERMFGFTEAEVLGKHPFEVVVPPQSHALVAGVFEKIKAGSMEAHGESENCTKDGRTIICEWYNTPLFDENGAFAGLLSLAQDITERKRLEDQLRQAMKMEAVGRLAGGVAHDFNNLLTIITGYSDLLLARPGMDPSVLESVKEIRVAGDRAAALTRQLLGFSRQTMLQPEILDLNLVVEDTGKMLRRLIGEDIRFTTVLDPQLNRVRVDPSQLDQVLMNLAVNARDAMPKGGRLTIETANVHLGDNGAPDRVDCPPGRYAMLAITDTGVGMSPDVRGRVFEPFFTTKEVGKGTGLGLAMVFGIVKQSGGGIAVDSEPGHGSTFRIYLPAVAEPEARKNESAFKLDVRGTERILIVEDEDSVRKLAFTSLKLQGYDVLAARDGKDALRIVEERNGSFDLLLTDVIMPNLSGPELAERMKVLFPRIKVLFMSGYTDGAVVRYENLEDDVCFIQKPYTPLGLARKVREVLDADGSPG